MTKFMGLLLVSVFFLMGVQHSVQYFLTSYAVAASPPLEFSTTAKAATLSTLYGGAFALGRLASVFAAARFPASLLLKCSAALTCSALGAVVALPRSSLALQGSACVLGAVLSPAFPSAINYAKRTLGASMTGGKLSMLMLGATMGASVVPQLVSPMLAKADAGAGAGALGPVFFMPLLLALSVACAACLASVTMAVGDAQLRPGKKDE